MQILRRVSLTRALLALAVTACTGRAASPQVVAVQQNPHDRLMAATASISLEEIKSRPWHLKVDATVYDSKGENPQTGTMELWRNGDDQRTILQFGDSKRTDLHSGGKSYGSTIGVLPYFADVVLDRMMHAGPVEDDFTGTKPSLSKETFNKTPFDCIMLARQAHGIAPVPLGLFPTYCLRRDTNELRISYDFGGQATVLNRVGKFLDHEVPLTLTISEGRAVVAKATVSDLATFTPSAAEFTPKPDETEMGDHPALISGAVIAGHKLHGDNPIYPADARMRHVSGTVILRAIIGRDGHIHSLKAMSCPDPYLVIAALYTVRQWTYTPYLLNGTPTDIDTTITVNFNLSPS